MKLCVYIQTCNMKVYVYIRACSIYICLDIYEYLYLTGVCVACVTGATCCCVLSKVVEIYIRW